MSNFGQHLNVKLQIMEANSEESGDQNEQQKRPEIVDDPELEALLNGKLCGHCISEDGPAPMQYN
jgi:hypothetical protein